MSALTMGIASCLPVAAAAGLARFAGLWAQASDANEDGGFSLQWSSVLEDQGIPLAIMGMLVVFSALVLVVSFITVLPKLVGGAERRAVSNATAAPTTPAAEDEAIPPHILAVIVAAVAEAIDEPHRILKTQTLTSSDMAWSVEGRRQHHISHRTRGRW